MIENFFFEGSAFGGAVSQKNWKKRKKLPEKKVIRKIYLVIVIRSSNKKASPGRTDSKVQIAFKHRPRVGWRQAWMTDCVAAMMAAAATYRRRKQGIENINQLALVLGLIDY